jgi:hypothetical protein
MRWLLVLLLFLSAPSFGQLLQPAPAPGAVQNEEQFQHVQSGMHFPAEVGGFRRSKVARFNRTGSDMGVDYRLNRSGNSIYLTLYIYPAAARWRPGADEDRTYDALEKNMICGQELKYRQQEMLRFHPDSALGAPQPIEVTQNSNTQHGMRFKFAAMENYGGTPQVAKEELDLFCFATELWTISYRFTYPDYAGADDDIAEFMRDLKWPQ